MNPHEKLLEGYTRELYDAKQAVERWWAALVARETQLAGNAAGLRLRWPDGPASHPRVIGIVRKYWLLCEELNVEQRDQKTRGEAVREEPHVFDPDLTLGGDRDAPLTDDTDGDEPWDEVYPHLFVHEWLLDDHEVLHAFLARLTYWAIGLDEHEQFT